MLTWYTNSLNKFYLHIGREVQPALTVYLSQANTDYEQGLPLGTGTHSQRWSEYQVSLISSVQPGLYVASFREDTAQGIKVVTEQLVNVVPAKDVGDVLAFDEYEFYKP